MYRNKKIYLYLCAIVFSLISIGFKSETLIASSKSKVAIANIEYREFNILQYSFENNVVKDAHVIEYKEGFRIIQPLYLKSNKQSLTFNQIADEFKKLPKVLAINIKEIELLDYSNINDKYWEKAHKIKNFRSYASGSDNKICFYANDHFSIEKSTKKLFPALAHEAAHILDEKIPSQKNRLSNSKEWTDTMEKDLAFNKNNHYGKYCSLYSQSASSNVEDFAEAVSQYVTDNARFVKEFPNRSKELEKLFNNKK